MVCFRLRFKWAKIGQTLSAFLRSGLKLIELESLLTPTKDKEQYKFPIRVFIIQHKNAP